MPDYYFHYTSRQGAQGIISSGQIEPGVSGQIYLSLDVYGVGAEAVDALAIENKPVEVVGLVPEPLVASQYRMVDFVLPKYDPISGVLIRRGGGTQIRIPGAMAAAAVRWLAVCPP